MDFREISPEHSRDDNKPKDVGKFWYLTYFSRASIYTTRLAHF